MTAVCIILFQSSLFYSGTKCIYKEVALYKSAFHPKPFELPSFDSEAMIIQSHDIRTSLILRGGCQIIIEVR